MLTVSTFFALKTASYPPFKEFSNGAMENFATSLVENVEEPFNRTTCNGFRQKARQWHKIQIAYNVSHCYSI